MEFDGIISAIKFLRTIARGVSLSVGVDGGIAYQHALDLKTAKLFVEAVMALGPRHRAPEGPLTLVLPNKIAAIKHVRDLARTATITTAVDATTGQVRVEVTTPLDLRTCKEIIEACLQLGRWEAKQVAALNTSRLIESYDDLVARVRREAAEDRLEEAVGNETCEHGYAFGCRGCNPEGR